MSERPQTIADLTSQQKKSGLAAWLGWMFDGLDMHLYTLVALPFVMQLLGTTAGADTAAVKYDANIKSALIQAAFLVGWALGGAFFGRVGDLLGRTRALNLTILTYAAFTGLSFFAQEWWHLLIFRFLAALGIGGEWAVGASLLAETWPRRWRPWLAAVLQSGVNVGVLVACIAGWLVLGVFDADYRVIFLVGILPALLTLWIRKAVPETEQWQQAHESSEKPGISALFAPGLRRTTLITLTICGLGLTAHWALMFWHTNHLRAIAEAAQWTKEARDGLAQRALYWMMIGSIVGNFMAGALAWRIGYRRSVGIIFAAYFVMMMIAYAVPRPPETVLWMLPLIGACQGVFALFTMCLPPLFPTLLRTTGAGFCYNFGRIASAAGVVLFGILPQLGKGAVFDQRLALFYSAWLFVPAAVLSWLLLPEPTKDAA